MENPLDLKLLMNQTSHVLSSCNTITALKAYKCDHCNTTYSDKSLFEMHKASHLKETNTFTVVKDQQMSQIVMTPGSQIMTTSQPTQQQQQQQQQQQHITSQMPIMIQEPDMSTYKKSYTPVEPQQVYTLVPMSQYQTMAGNNRVINVAGSHDNQGSNPSFATPMYIVISTPEGQQLQPITEIVQQDSINSQDIQGQILQVNNQIPLEVQNITRGPGDIQVSRMSPEVLTSTKMSPEIQVSRIAGEMKVNRISNNNQLPTRITNRLLSVKDRPFKCDQCTASFIESSELEDHKKKHTGDGPFTCEDCHFTFMYKSHFRSHKTRCQKKKTSLTKPTIFTSSSLKRKFPTNHIKQEPRVLTVPVNVSTPKAVPVSVVHPIRNQPRQVSSKQPTPSKFNPNKPSFKRIKKETNKERPYECQECDASFCNDADLNTHRNKHTGEGPFKCDDCKFVFLYRKLYEAHKRRCDRKKKDTHILPQDSALLSSDQTTFLHQDQRVLSHQQYILPEVTNRIYSAVSEGSAMQLIQPSILEMRPAVTDGSEISNQAIIEQVAVSPSNLSGRQEYKYEVIPTMDGVNVNQIMNLIKVKDQ